MSPRRTTGERMFDISNVTFLVLISIIVFIPLIHVTAGAFSSVNALVLSRVTLWPVEFTMENIQAVIQNGIFWRAFGVTVAVVVIGTTVNMALTVMTAYPLSKSYLRGRKVMMLYIIFTLIFQAPVIPTYLVVKWLGMLNTIWSLIIPVALSAFNLLLALTFFRSVPEELFEAAKIDGMSEYKILWRIAVPLSMPIIVTLILFYSVSHWNSYYLPLLYISDLDLRTLQMYLYGLVSQGNAQDAISADVALTVSPESIQMATILVATLPIVVVYPFLQKHFIKGALLGSLKE